MHMHAHTHTQHTHSYSHSHLHSITNTSTTRTASHARTSTTPKFTHPQSEFDGWVLLARTSSSRDSRTWRCENPRLLAIELVLPIRADKHRRNLVFWHALDLRSRKVSGIAYLKRTPLHLLTFPRLPNQQIALLRHLGPALPGYWVLPDCIGR